MTPESDSRQRRQRSLSGPHTQVFSRQNGEVLHAGRHHSVVIGEEFGIGRRRYASLVRKRKCGGRGINGGGGGGGAITPMRHVYICCSGRQFGTCPLFSHVFAFPRAQFRSTIYMPAYQKHVLILQKVAQREGENSRFTRVRL